MKTELHKAEDRGYSELDWLKSHFSFSFADYYNPTRMGFGKLRVINDDWIAPGHGFGSHPHDNMEIISVVRSGALAHKDNTGSETVVRPGDVQVMSAGSGIEHSEYNHSSTEPAELFQIWIQTAQQDVEPRHEERTFDVKENQLTLVVSGNKQEEVLFIHQDAKISLGKFTEQKDVSYAVDSPNGVFVLVVEGSAEIDGKKLGRRDALAVTETEDVVISVQKETELLVIEVPM